MTKTMMTFKKQKFNFLAVFFFALLFSSCAHLVQLDRAQDAFSKGAEIENASRLDPSSISASSPQSYYNIAYTQVNKALQAKGKLQKVDVLGTTYAIKALSAWKLKYYDEARESAIAAKNYIKSGSVSMGAKKSYSRDYYVMEAMDALVTIEATNDSVFLFLDTIRNISTDQTMLLYKELIHNDGKTGRIEDAILQLDTISASVSKKHEVRTYFNMSQLAGLKIWSDALSNIKALLKKQNAYRTNLDWYEDEEDLFEQMKTQYLEKLADKIPNGKDDPVYLYWKFIL